MFALAEGMNFLLIAVLSSSAGSILQSNVRGYQTSVMQRFDSLEQCKLAAGQLVLTYKAGNSLGSPEKGQIRCVDLTSGKETIVENVP